MSEFKREERYIVVKRKNMNFIQEEAMRAELQLRGIPTTECVVVESDWPEYETVWKMIEARVTGSILDTPDVQSDVPDPDDRNNWSEAAHVCAEAYQVVGSLLSDLGAFNHPAAIKVLDNLSARRRVHHDVLPWPAIKPSVQSGAVADATNWLRRKSACESDNAAADCIDALVAQNAALHIELAQARSVQSGKAVGYAASLECNDNGWIDVRAWREGEFTTPLYAHPQPAPSDSAQPITETDQRAGK